MKTNKSEHPGLDQIRRFDRSLPMALLRGHEAVLRTFIPHLRQHGLSTQQWRVMRALAEFESLDVSELSARCSLHRPSVSRIIQNLEARHILSRRSCENDSRRSLVSITEVGLSLIDQIAPESEALYDHIEARYGGEQLALLYRLLEDLVRSLEEPLQPQD